MLVEFITISKTFSNNFKLITNSKNVLLVHEIVEKHHAASRKCKTQFGRKINWFVVVDKRHAHPGKIKLHHNRPNSLANAAHAASEFRKQRLTFLSGKYILKNGVQYIVVQVALELPFWGSRFSGFAQQSRTCSVKQSS